MGLPAAFAAAAVKLHVNVGRLVDQISTLATEMPEPSRAHRPSNEQETSNEDPAAQRGRQLMETLQDICKRDYQYDIGEVQLGEVLDDLYSQIAEIHEVQSPQAIERLRVC